MNKLHNTIALQNKQAVVLTASTGEVDDLLVRALMLEISQLGYTFDADVIDVLKTQKEMDFLTFRTHLIETLREMVGAHVKYRPLFKKFPDDIPDDAEYFIKRLVGYVTNQFDIAAEAVTALSCGHVIDPRLFNMDDFGACPICQRQVDETTDVTNRPPLKDYTMFKLITLVDKNEVYSMFTNLLAAKSSISEDNRNAIGDLVEQENMISYIPDVIPMKENIALIAGLLIKHTNEADAVLIKHFKTATDVLRLAVQLSEGDVSLKEATRFKLNNKERRVIMALLDNISNPEEDMLRYRMRWVRLGEVLHTGSKKKRYPNAFSAIDTIRNRADSVVTFGSKVEKQVLAVKAGDPGSMWYLISHLVTRPGEFARRLDFVLRYTDDTDAVVSAFRGAVSSLTTPMLLTISSHMKTRTEKSPFRYFLPKGSVAKMQVIDDDRATIDPDTVHNIVVLIEQELHDRFSKLDSLGKVYINPILENYILPLSQRSAAKSLVTIPRGSRVEIPDTKAIRMFLYWKDQEGGDYGSTVDVDLSAVAYDNNWNCKGHLSYTQLSGVGGVHSGDIQSAPNGAAEFIDIDINKALGKGIRYITMNVISYTGQNFDTFECLAGVMGRDKTSSGEVFEPKTVTHKFDVAGNTGYNIPLIFDLVTRQLIWTDLALSSSVFSNVENNAGPLVTMAKAAEAMIRTKPTMFELFRMHLDARALDVDFDRDPDKEYDTVLDVDMATKLDDILANWM